MGISPGDPGRRINKTYGQGLGALTALIYQAFYEHTQGDHRAMLLNGYYYYEKQYIF